jgi:N-formylglutamate amidohydrolase
VRRSDVVFVDELFISCLNAGAPMLRAHFPRAFIDLNREPYELDPAMFDGPLPVKSNTRSMRVAGGLGTIARIVSDGTEIYRGRIPVKVALDRIDRYYKPYHRALTERLETTRSNFGHVVLIDCHSMPSAKMVQENRPRADFVLGDRYGTSCAPGLTDHIHKTLKGMGYTVARNKPYAGGFITERYGNPAHACHAIQIEINRALYLDEHNYSRSSQYAWLVADLTRLVRSCVSLGLDTVPVRPEAAE